MRLSVLYSACTLQSYDHVAERHQDGMLPMRDVRYGAMWQADVSEFKNSEADSHEPEAAVSQIESSYSIRPRVCLTRVNLNSSHSLN